MLIKMLKYGFPVLFIIFTAVYFQDSYPARAALTVFIWFLAFDSHFLKKDKKPPVKGVIQYDNRYETARIRVVFNGNPLECMKYSEIVLKVDKDADLKDLN